MKTKLFFPLCAMIALPSVVNAIPPRNANAPESQTAMVPLCAGNQLAANVFKAMPVEEAQTACRYFKIPAADAQNLVQEFGVNADAQTALNCDRRALPVEEAQTACEEFTGQDAQKANALCSIDWDSILKYFNINPTII